MFSGNRCGNVPLGFGACDMILEQLPPTRAWGESFVTVPRSGPRNLDSGLSEISIVFQAAVPKLVASKYTTSGVRRPSAL